MSRPMARRPSGPIALARARDETALLRWAATVLIAAAMLLGLAAAARAAPAPDSFADLAEKLLPTVVNISTTQKVEDGADLPEMPQFPPGSPFEEFFRDFFNRRGQGGQGQGERPTPHNATALGSGFIVRANGFIVTNYHVIEGAEQITVVLHDNTSLDAKLIGRDEKTDLAVLKVESAKPLPFVDFGDSDKMRVGDWVLAIGNPFGLGGTVTAGIISARSREINAGPYDDFLQTDAAINRGNSGGPMFNMDGQVIGINTAIYSPSGGSVGIGFAIPSALASGVVDQIIQFGRTKRGWLGVRIQSVTPEIAESLGLEKAEGALVAGITDGGPAAKSGIETGDVILTFDGKPIGESRRLPRVVADTPVDKQVPVVVWRKGQRKELPVTLGDLEAAEESGLLASNTPDGPGEATKPESLDALGVTLSAITDALKKQYSLADDQKGVVVTAVTGGSPAGEKGLKAGDVIVEVGQAEVANPADVAKKVKEARDGGRKSVLLLVQSGADLRFVALPVGQG
ncbi:DegQ family serine endoprotease [Inquilinus sp. 2KB_12]|uniref:Serine protease Do n=2 Tax=Rhodospirillaceae TaxID=41295 RepID=A0ABU1JJR3_9PROT|nr:DegQ family serine endoprotease [Inquilinus ginsengisoli]MDR6288567.1 serine protease Do [Inquilinus ginsengisoli]